MTSENRMVKENLIKEVKSIGEEIIRRADQIVGEPDLITALHIEADIDINECPTIKWTQESVNKTYVNSYIEIK